MRLVNLRTTSLALLTVTVLSAATLSAAEPKVGEVPPAISAAAWINAPTNAKVDLSAAKGKVVVVEFWATWCPPCRKAIPHLVELYNANKDKGLIVFSLTDEPKQDVEKFVKDNKMTYIIGTGSKSGGAYGVEGIPHAFVIGKDGKIVWTGHPLDEKFTQAVKGALAAEAAKK